MHPCLCWCLNGSTITFEVFFSVYLHFITLLLYCWARNSSTRVAPLFDCKVTCSSKQIWCEIFSLAKREFASNLLSVFHFFNFWSILIRCFCVALLMMPTVFPFPRFTQKSSSFVCLDIIGLHLMYRKCIKYRPNEKVGKRRSEKSNKKKLIWDVMVSMAAKLEMIYGFRLNGASESKCDVMLEIRHTFLAKSSLANKNANIIISLLSSRQSQKMRRWWKTTTTSKTKKKKKLFSEGE